MVRESFGLSHHEFREPLLKGVRGGITVHGVVGVSLHLVPGLADRRGGSARSGAYAAAGAASSRATRRLNASCAAAVTGPGACGSAMSSTAAIGITSRTDEAMNASSAARASSSVHGGLGHVELLEQAGRA